MALQIKELLEQEWITPADILQTQLQSQPFLEPPAWWLPCRLWTCHDQNHTITCTYTYTHIHVCIYMLYCYSFASLLNELTESGKQ